MGSVQDVQVIRSDIVPPWGGMVFGAPGIVDSMLQEITLRGHDVEDAWQDAVIKMEAADEEWETQHPDWQSSDCQ